MKFFHRVGLNYVSCSPFRVPIARLAAAQAVVEDKLAAKKAAAKAAPKKVKPAKKAKAAKKPDKKHKKGKKR